MKISTDAVLLGALAEADSSASILDIGTGTGVISLMLAQRFRDATSTGVELDEDAANQAVENFLESPFANRLKVVKCRFQDLEEDQLFDLIVSNPPYFPDHLKAKDSKRNQALHTDALSFEELLQKAFKLLKVDGQLWVILPPRQMSDFSELARGFGLLPKKRVQVKDTASKPVIREIVGFSFGTDSADLKEIYLKNEDGSFSGAYSSLISGFLLGF
ncbi:MAG: methyltransferase [Algoriphagus sp.]|nr:methyltransferase [Algoriphagus sp.]